ncbi:hypothetical protein ACOME3_008508 [Neoechinorhynchus agilis]
MCTFNKNNEIQSSSMKTYCFYQCSDLSLGNFLNRLEFTLVAGNSKFATIVHNHSMLVLQVFQMKNQPTFVSRKRNSDRDVRLMWMYCRDCKASTPTRFLPSQAMCLSFGKFLELLFYSDLFLMHSCPRETHVKAEWYLYSSKVVSESLVTSIHRTSIENYVFRFTETSISMESDIATISVNENEFTSVVAYCLNQDLYRSWISQTSKTTPHFEHQFKINDTNFYCPCRQGAHFCKAGIVINNCSVDFFKSYVSRD